MASRIEAVRLRKESPHKRAAPDERYSEPDAFLLGETGHFHRGRVRHPSQANAHHHPENTVVSARVRDRIEMRTNK